MHATCWYKLIERAVGSFLEDAQSEVTLYRGMRNLTLSEAFKRRGGSENAPMSTSSDASVAASYSVSECALLFKVPRCASMRAKTVLFMQGQLETPSCGSVHVDELVMP